MAADVTRESWVFSHDAPPAKHCASACKWLFPLRHTGRTRLCGCFHPDWVKFPLWRENVNVSFTPVLSFIMIKQFILREKGWRETQAAASFIACPVSFARLWFSIMLLSAAAKRLGPAPKQISHILLFLPLSFFYFVSLLPPSVVSPISLFILHMWLPAC